jgi:hypothetical protein
VSLKNSRNIIQENVSDEENEEDSPPPPPPPPIIQQATQEEVKTSFDIRELNQKMETLSLEVKNAMHVIQEMTYSTLTHIDNHMPARSIPNLQNGINHTHMVSEYLTRSSSQPAEIWHRNNSTHHIKSISDLYW